MNDLDEIFVTSAERQTSPSPKKKDWKEERNALFKLADDTAVEAVFSGENFRKYLEIQSKFDRYSATNALLIMAQKPEATQLRDFSSWQEAGVQIKKDEKSISIFEPGKEYKSNSGETKKYFNVRKIFDISQTTAQPEAEPNVALDEKLLLKALIHRAPVSIQMVDSLERNRGALYDHEQKTLFVIRGMSAPDIFRNVSQELAHAELAALRKEYRRSDCEFSAYCASFILCEKNGIDTKNYNFSRIPDSIRNMEPKEIREVLTEIRETAANISERMSRLLEHGKPPKQNEQER